LLVVSVVWETFETLKDFLGTIAIHDVLCPVGLEVVFGL
jgi:hypothetical protein